MFSDSLSPDAAISAQRARGRIALDFRATGLARLRQEGCGRCLMPNPPGGDPMAVTINTAGGLTGGDRFGVETMLGQGARLVLTTQGAERIYRSAGGVAEIANRAVLADGASLAWLPQETILFERAAMTRRFDVDLAGDARFLGLEMLVLGRRAMGEDVTCAQLTDNWRVRRDGRIVHAEALRLVGDITAVSAQAALLDRMRALATLVLIARDAEAVLDRARGLLPAEGMRAAASAGPGRLVVRFMAADLMPLKAALRRMLAGLPGVAVPPVWQI